MQQVCGFVIGAGKELLEGERKIDGGEDKSYEKLVSVSYEDFRKVPYT
ncbi:MAG: hypothetical protein ACXQTG_01940 [Methanoculleaceae archaeon]